MRKAPGQREPTGGGEGRTHERPTYDKGETTMTTTQERKKHDYPTTPVVRRVTGKRRWSELTIRDRTKVARRCLRDFERAVRDGSERTALDELQDARSLIDEARAEIERKGVEVAR